MELNIKVNIQTLEILWQLFKYKQVKNIDLFELNQTFKMDNLEKQPNEKGCNCKNSKCMKLYCECFSAKIPCGKNCRCCDCKNSSRDIFREGFMTEKRSTKQIIRGHKGCSCRRSNCTKKYCDCYQSGMSCNEYCKCVDCQNNESFRNLKVINKLRKHNSEVSNTENNSNLYPLYLSQNSDHLKSIIKETNPFSLEEDWLENAAQNLYFTSLDAGTNSVLKKLIQILSVLEQNITKNPVRNQQSQLSFEIPLQLCQQRIPNDKKFNRIQRKEQKQKYQGQIYDPLSKNKMKQSKGSDMLLQEKAGQAEVQSIKEIKKCQQMGNESER